MKKIFIFLPILLALTLVAGIFLGKKLTVNQTSHLPFDLQLKGNSKLNQVISYIESDYVDTITDEKLIEKTITEMLQTLDPHSYYIPPQDYHALNDPLEGNFEGIGVEFRITNDTIMIVNPLGGGPSEKLGIMAGDRIIKVDSKLVAGIGVENQDVMKLLKGKKGTKVNVSIYRPGQSKLIDFTITRDEIPLHSVETAYMLTDKIGYIRISRFAKNTYEEFLEATADLKSKGMEKIVVDLRNNGGGFLTSATAIADEFLSKGELIVYTKGKSRPKEDFLATARGSLEKNEVVILINEGSASASEILAGALQDNDKGIIIGRRSFGKGLVQEGIQWPDGSAMRLTVARYYTPTGRSIQKPYDKGLDAYNEEAYDRYTNGEMQTADSVHFADSLKYKTPKGKIVYGGGGIMPDIFVPIDTVGTSDYFGILNYRGLFYQYSFEYVDQHRQELNSKYQTADSFLKNFSVSEAILSDFVKFAEQKEVKKDAKGLSQSKELIKNRLKAIIGRNLYGDNVFYPIVNKTDNTIGKAIEVLEATK